MKTAGQDAGGPPAREAPRGDARPRILIVEDEQDYRRLLARMLKSAGEYEILEAADGMAAMDVLTSQSPEVVIADLVMPRLDGLSLMRWAQQNQPGAAWIILSGQATVDRAVDAVRLGAFDFLCKPLDAAETLLLSVRNALQQQRLAAERERLNRELAQRNARLSEQVEQLTRACGMLCEQAETIEEDLRRAELIQRQLLLHDPPPPGRLAVNTIYRPSREVGGDLYDVVQIDDRHWVAYVADAAGHGVSAAMLAVLFKQRLGMLDDDRRARMPAEVLRSVNQAVLTECGAPGLFITAAYCLIDTAAGGAAVASAGHPPLLLHHADGQDEMIYHTGPALGIFPDANFAQKHLRLRSGDRLLLYTDGLCNAPDRQRALSNEQILRALGESRADGQGVLERLLAAASAARDEAPQEDDITLVLLTASTGQPSSVDNGPITPTPPALTERFAHAAEVLVGFSGQTCAVSVQGNGTWVQSQAFHDFCATALEARRPLMLDMSLCPYLDSTFLGTILELTTVADRTGTTLWIQGVLPEVRGLLEELGMVPVLQRITTDMLPLPSQMRSLTGSTMNEQRDRERILHAHEALASLNQRNRAEFAHLIECIRGELQEAPSGNTSPLGNLDVPDEN